MERIVICAVATVCTLIWTVLSFQNTEKYNVIIESIDPKEFYFPELLSIGFLLTQTREIDWNDEKVRVRLKELAELKSPRYAEFYYRVMRAAKVTYALVSVVLFSILAAIKGDTTILFLGFLTSALLVMHVDGKMNDALKARREALISELPQMLSKLALLVNSGMVTRDAWRKIALSGQGILYQEMRITLKSIENGVSEFQAYREFGERCAVKEVKRFTSTMVQNLKKQNAELSVLLRETADEMWEAKKNLAKQKGAAVSSQLMFPTALIFVGIMLLVMIPAFSGLTM